MLIWNLILPQDSSFVGPVYVKYLVGVYRCNSHAVVLKAKQLCIWLYQYLFLVPRTAVLEGVLRYFVSRLLSCLTEHYYL
jgi:hypothetical protein